jgi:hypothetical protein
MAACAGHYQAAHNAAFSAGDNADLAELEMKLGIQRIARQNYLDSSALSDNERVRIALVEAERKIAGSVNAMDADERTLIRANCDRATEQIIAQIKQAIPLTDDGPAQEPRDAAPPKTP